jgi:hypothetical protein
MHALASTNIRLSETRSKVQRKIVQFSSQVQKIIIQNCLVFICAFLLRSLLISTAWIYCYTVFHWCSIPTLCFVCFDIAVTVWAVSWLCAQTYTISAVNSSNQMRHALLHVSNNPMLKFHFAFRRKSQVPSTLADSQQLYSVQTVMLAQLTLIVQPQWHCCDVLT